MGTRLGGGGGGGAPGGSCPDSFLEHGVGGGSGAHTYPCVSGPCTRCLEGVFRHTHMHWLAGVSWCSLGPALLPSPGARPLPHAYSCQELGPPLDTISQEPEKRTVIGKREPWLLGTCMAAPLPLKTQTFCACEDGEWPWPWPWALCRGNPTGNEPGQMAALPVLVPGTRMCCLTSGGGPGRLAALRGLACSQLAPPDPKGTGLGWGLMVKSDWYVCMCV